MIKIMQALDQTNSLLMNPNLLEGLLQESIKV